jgi:hypothetical protein
LPSFHANGANSNDIYKFVNLDFLSYLKLQHGKVKELNALYNQAFKECLKPWYYRWETWLAFATGLAIGIPL